MRLITKFEFYWLLEYLVGICSVGLDSSKWKESAISKRTELCWEWWGKLESQILSLMLKFSVMMSTLLMLTSVSLKYFKADWDESEYKLIKRNEENVNEYWYRLQLWESCYLEIGFWKK